MKKTLLMILFTIFCFGVASAQKPMKVKVQTKTEKVYDVVEQMPSFPGGQAKLMRYLAENAKYPQDAYEETYGGRVIVQFVVEKDGSISNVEILKSVFPSLDEEAMRLVKEMPHWNPGKQNNKPVRVKYTVPVSFHPQ